MKVKLLDKNCLPVKKHEFDAGYDIKLREAVRLKPHEVKMVPAGIKVELKEGTFGQISARSSVFKQGVNIDGILDCTYRGEVGIMLQNTTNEVVEFKQYERVAQLIEVRINSTRMQVVDELSESVRSVNGFGSTGRF